MGCCGGKREQAAQLTRQALGVATGTQPESLAPVNGAGMAMGTDVVLVYDGTAPLVVTGSKTGRRYRFGGRGARLAVAAADIPGLRHIEKLRML